MNAVELTTALKAKAAELGFALCGACPAISPPGAARLREWLAAGYAGEMHYLSDRAAAYEHPGSVLAGVQSLLMLGLPYRTVESAKVAAGQGRISRYAWGPADYHDVIHDKLHALADYLRALSPLAKVRGVVDTAPLLEREFAQLAGLGWVGKHTLLIHRERGSWFFLAALLTDLPLAYDTPFATDHCGTCTACLDACPTDAFPAPYVLDATRCISYLTIELRNAIGLELREGLGDWLFGCDICQDVCPWNRKSPATNEAPFMPEPEQNPVNLSELFALDDGAFRERFRHTPLWRSKRRGILRNAALVLGNQRDPNAFAPLVAGLNDSEPLVRGASAWALGQLNISAAQTALVARRRQETEPEVLTEIDRALGQSSSGDGE